MEKLLRSECFRTRSAKREAYQNKNHTSYSGTTLSSTVPVGFTSTLREETQL